MTMFQPTMMYSAPHLIVVFLCIFLKKCEAWSITGQGEHRLPQQDAERTTPQPSWAAHMNLSDKQSRRVFLSTAALWTAYGTVSGTPSNAAEDSISTDPLSLLEVQVVASGDAKKIFNEGRALESQGNMAAAQRLYGKVTKISPRFVYGWSNLGNTQTAFGELAAADESYTTAIKLCEENIRTVEAQDQGFGARKCNDLYVLFLNRGSIRLNNNMPKEALADLQRSVVLRNRPDAIVLQNLARAEELNGMYYQADKDYNVAISMTANEVNPFWLRSSMVKLQLGDVQGGFDIFKRVENRFPEAPEVRAAYAVFLAARGDAIAAQRKFLEIPDRQRLKYSDDAYLTRTISWPPAMVDTISRIATAVGDKRS